MQWAFILGPLPTLPLNWCNWDNPSLSAFSIIIKLAFGTSIPTSITVVQTKTSIFPSLKFSITESFWDLFNLLWTKPTFRFLLFFEIHSFADSAAWTSRLSDSSIIVQSQKAWFPSEQITSRRSTRSSFLSFDITEVITGFLPGGISSIFDTLKSAKIVIARVLGIGVAVIKSWWGKTASFDFWSISNLCFTPNLCCSSTTTRERFFIETLFWKTECVPIKIFIFPERKS